MWMYTLFPQILNMSLSASIVMVFVLIARLLLKKTPKIFSYALWAVVLFRLLCPVSISSNLSLLNVFDAPFSEAGSVEYIPTDIVHTENPQVTIPVPGISEFINENLPQGEEQLVADPLEVPMAVATLVWLIGMLALLLHSIISLIKLHRKLIGAVPLRDNVYLADHIASPFVMGLLRPEIYLPSTLTEQEQTYIIQHEQHHIRRFDPIIKILAFASLCVHWFNPLMWLAFVLSCKDMEMSCDEAVMKAMDGDIRAEYSTSLLSLATGRKIFAGTPLAFGEGNTKSRIKNVMNYKKPTFLVIIIVFISCIIMAVCFLTNPVEEQDLSFLNYNNLLSTAMDEEQLPVHVSTQSSENDYAIDGNALATYLGTVRWSSRQGIFQTIAKDTRCGFRKSVQTQPLMIRQSNGHHFELLG